MAVIGSIRKHGVLLMVIIGFALVLFLLMGLFDGNTLNRFLHADDYTKGKVDGEYIDDRYNKLYEDLTLLFKVVNDKSTLEEAESYFIHELTWEQVIAEITVGKELESLGIVYTDELTEVIMDEVFATLSTQQPNNYMMSYFSYLVKIFGVETAQQIILSVRDAKDVPEYAEVYGIYKVLQDRIVFEHKLRMYQGFSVGTMNFSDAMATKIAADNKVMTTQLLTVNPQHAAFAEIDATVSDKDLKKWYDGNKTRFKNDEETRDIDIAIFPIQPTATDKANIEADVRAQFERFQATEIDSFNRNESFSVIDSVFRKKGEYMVVNTKSGYTSIETIDTLEQMIFNAGVGNYIEPFNYQDQTWFYGKTFGAAQRPDSVMVAFLIVDYRNSQNPAGTRSKKQARLEADSLKNVVLSGQTSIFELRPQYMAGNNFTDTTMWLDEERTIRDLYNGLVGMPEGDVYIHNAQAAFVVYQVLAKTEPVSKRQYALYAMDVQASEETVSALRAQAQKLAASSNTTEEFIAEANNAGVQILPGKNVKSMAAIVNQFECRPVVAWAFSDNTAKNSVSDVYKLDNGYFVVASLVNILPKGVPSFEDVKDVIAMERNNMRKVELVKEKIASEISGGKSMKDLATLYGATVVDSVRLTFLGEQGQNRGVDNGVTGEIFGKGSNSGTQVIAGKINVFVLAPGSIVDGQQPSETLQQEKFLLQNICTGRGARNEYAIITGLKRNIEIIDNRAKFYR